MGLKESNEITVKIKCELQELYEILEKKGFKISHIFSMDDYYYIPQDLKLEELSEREILSKAILLREICGKLSGRTTRMLTVKFKDIHKNGNILNQKTFNCKIYEMEDGKNFLNAIGYKEIMNIKEDDIVYEKDGFELAIKDIKNGDNLIEVETDSKNDLDTIEKLIKKIEEIQIPIFTDNFFVKKAEIELNKVLKNNKKLP